MLHATGDFCRESCASAATRVLTSAHVTSVMLQRYEETALDQPTYEDTYADAFAAGLKAGQAAATAQVCAGPAVGGVCAPRCAATAEHMCMQVC